MYNWRRLTPEDRQKLLTARRTAHRPWHSPPHRLHNFPCSYIISAACYEHAPIIGHSAERMTDLSERLLAVCDTHAKHVFAWCVLPDHYHVVLHTSSIEDLLASLAKLHGRTSYEWNGEENRRGRKVWFNAVEREMRSDRHLWASINYVHHNPVKHGYVQRWQDWLWSSAQEFLNEVGRDKATEIWNEYEVRDYGKGWDD